MGKMSKRLTLLALITSVVTLGCNTSAVKKTDTAAKMNMAPVASKQDGGPGKNKEFMLANGLKIIVRPDHRAPIVVSQIWYKAGSSYETNGRTGVAHLLEHMMFKGTDKHGPNEFSRIIAENGGRENAFTGPDYTAYFQRLEKSRLAISFEMEADRMQNLNLSKKEFEKEIKVVMEERRMRTDDKPRSVTYEQFAAAAFVNSPYHHPVIGWMDDLKNMTVQDAQDWYDTYYAPNNATLVVVGDVDPQEVYQLANKYYGPLKSKQIPKVKPQTEIPQVGTRSIVVKAPAKVAYMVMGYKVPVVATAEHAWEPYALEMLAHVLDGGDSARFNKNLIRGSQIAASVGSGYDIYSRLGDLFIIDGTPSKGKTVAELQTAIEEQINIVKNELVSEKELERIKTQVIASKVYEKDSIFYQSMQLGTLETVGLDWRLMDQFVEKFRAVTAEQVKQVAIKYLVENGLTTARLDPQPMGGSMMPSGHDHGGASHGK